MQVKSEQMSNSAFSSKTSEKAMAFSTKECGESSLFSSMFSNLGLETNVGPESGVMGFKNERGIFKNDVDVFKKDLDIFNTKDSQVIHVKDDRDKFEVSLDTSQYRPDEIKVLVREGVISIEGKHEEKSEDGRKMVSRQFSRKYSLPAGAKAENVVSNLSSDGVLLISVDKTTLESHSTHVQVGTPKTTRVPLNLRDTFFTDSFFKSNWEEFEKFQESLKLRSNIFLDTFLEIPSSTSNENKFCSLITKNYQAKNQIEKQIRKANKDEQSQEEKLSLHMDKTNLQSIDTKFDKFSPRRWMLPMFSKLDLENNFNIDHSRNVISYKDDQNLFELKLDISEYEPEEVKVTVSPDGILVEGSHEEKSIERKQNLYRSFTRKYSLPHGVRQEDVLSKFATNHVLIISAKKEVLHSEQIRIKDQSKDVSIANTSRNSELNVKERENRAATQKEVSSCNISSKSIRDEDHSSRNVKIEKVLGTKEYRTNESSKIEVHSKLEEEKSTLDEKKYRTIKIDHQKDAADKLESLTSSGRGVPTKVERSPKTNNTNITNIDIKYDTQDLQASKEMSTSAKYECDRNIDINVSKSYTHTNDQSALKSQNVSKRVNIELESEELEPEKSKEKVKSKTFDDTSRVAKDEKYLCSQVKNESIHHSDLSATSKTGTELTQIQVNHQKSPKAIKKNITKKEGKKSPDIIWGLPSILEKDLDLFQTEDSQVIRITNDEKKFEVSLDTSQYRPDELHIKVAEGVISVEAKHEEKSEDARKMVSRQFSRKYSLPAGAKEENVVSNLSSDGVLVITVDKTSLVVTTTKAHIERQNVDNMGVVHKEAKLPITLRNSFLDDQFFQSNWHNFESIKTNMTRESEEMWKRIEKEFNQMQLTMIQNTDQSENNRMMDSSKMSTSLKEWMAGSNSSTHNQTASSSKDSNSMMNTSEELIAESKLSNKHPTSSGIEELNKMMKSSEELMAESMSSHKHQSASNSIKESNKLAKSLEEWMNESQATNINQSIFNTNEESKKMARSLKNWMADSMSRGIDNENTLDTSSVLDRSGRMPRKWMIPNMLNRKIEQLDLFQTKDSQVIRMKDDDEKFEVSLDTFQYRPDELSINVGEGIISVEGKHEEKSEDGRKMVSRQFSRKYSLPAGAEAENVVSNLSANGVLVISAPKVQIVEQRKIPIKSQ